MYDQRYDPTIQTGTDNCETIPSVLVIDSAYRDNATDTPGDYTVTLINKYPDVTSVELVYAGIPNSNYNITANNNKLHIMPTGTMTAITNYSGGTATEDADSIGAAGAYTFSSLVGDTRPGEDDYDNDNTFTITHNADRTINNIVVTAGGANWNPGETVTVAADDFTPALATDLTFTVAETTVTEIEVSPGLYTNANLVGAINTQLGNINVNNEEFTCALLDEDDATTSSPIGVFTVTAGGVTYPFGIKVVSESSGTNYMPQSMARILGFRPQNSYSTLNGDDEYMVQSNYPLMTEMDHYIAMYIEGMERCDGNHSGIHGAFCVVPLDAQLENFGMFKDSNKVDNDKFKYYFNQPKKLSKLHITFRDWEGNIYDFNGQNHLLIFKVETATHRRKFTIRS